MSTPPRPARGPALVSIRLMGPADAVTFAAERLALVLHVAKVSRDYTNRPPSPDIRRYIDVLVDGDDLLAGEAGRRG